jgi:2-polyprenyl-6-hydroxyphenyl methylase/3-demethylubiquinone-9 3-methyltransferase
MTSPSQAIIPNKYANPGSSGCHTYILPAFFDLCPELGAHTRVLDVGCGNGAVTAQVAQRGSEVLGIDMSETGIQLARRNCPNARFEVLPADAYLLRNLDEEPFDLVYSLEVIEHLYQVPSFIEGCFAATRRGGTFICSTPYHGYAKNLMIALTDGWDRHHSSGVDGEHIQFFSRKSLSRLLEKIGFRDLKFRGAGRAPYLWKSMVISAVRP